MANMVYAPKKLGQIKSSANRKDNTKIKMKNIVKNEGDNIVKTEVIKETPLKKKNSNLKAAKGDEVDIVNNEKVPKTENVSWETRNVSTIKSDNEDSDKQDSDNENFISENNLNKKKIDPQQNDRTVFVGNIPSNTKINQLKKLFSKCTVTSCRFRLANGKPILKHKMRKEADSINAWLVFDHIKDVELAIKLNGCEFKGRHIRVTKAQEKISNVQNEKCTIFVGNLKYSANDEKLYSIFSSCGEIEFVRTIQNAKGCSGVAYVCFKKADSVGLALELNKTLLDDRPINVEKYSKNKSGTSKNRMLEKEMSGVVRRITSKLMKDKIQNKNEGKLQFNNFSNKRGENKNPSSNKFKNQNTALIGKKKSEFRGIKVDSKKKFKKKNNKSPLHALAKKIAPKE